MNRPIKNTQVVNIFADLATNQNNINVGINLRFVPDAFIVRQLAYSCAAVTNNALQVYSDLAEDLILCVFYDESMNTAPNTTFLMSQKVQNKVWNFQVQFSPRSNLGFQTGPGPLATANGELSLLLEFVQFE